MPILHQVLREMIRVVRNATKQLALAYQDARLTFVEYPAYFKPYQNAFEVIGLAEELENDYFQHAAITTEDSIQENITPLQAAAIFSRLFNQESFFMLHEYSLLAFSQLKEISDIVEKNYSGNKSTLITQLGAVNWVTRFELLAERLAEVIATEVKAAEKKELVEMQDFIKNFAITSMQYLDSLKAFQTHVVAGEVAGDSECSINQVLLELNAKQTELNICRRKLETIANNLNGFWAEFYSLDDSLPIEIEWLTKRSSILERDEIPLLSQQLQQEHQNILSNLQKYRGALNNLREKIGKLDASIRQKMQETEPPEKSSTLAWKRAILDEDAEYLKKLLECGLDPQVISNYLSLNNKAATLQQDQISAVLIKASLMLFQEQPQAIVASSSASKETGKPHAVAEKPEQKTIDIVQIEEDETPPSSPVLTRTKKTHGEAQYKSDSLKACGNAKLVSAQKGFFAQQIGAPKKVAAKAAAAKKSPTNFQH